MVGTGVSQSGGSLKNSPFSFKFFFKEIFFFEKIETYLSKSPFFGVFGQNPIPQIPHYKSRGIQSRTLFAGSRGIWSTVDATHIDNLHTYNK